MLAGLNLIDERDGLRWHLHEEAWEVGEHPSSASNILVSISRWSLLTVIVMPRSFVECSQLGWRQVLVVLVTDLMDLRS
jgi:hypothetical protein